MVVMEEMESITAGVAVEVWAGVRMEMEVMGAQEARMEATEETVGMAVESETVEMVVLQAEKAEMVAMEAIVA